MPNRFPGHTQTHTWLCRHCTHHSQTVAQHSESRHTDPLHTIISPVGHTTDKAHHWLSASPLHTSTQSALPGQKTKLAPQISWFLRTLLCSHNTCTPQVHASPQQHWDLDTTFAAPPDRTYSWQIKHAISGMKYKGGGGLSWPAVSIKTPPSHWEDTHGSWFTLPTALFHPSVLKMRWPTLTAHRYSSWCSWNFYLCGGSWSRNYLWKNWWSGLLLQFSYGWLCNPTSQEKGPHPLKL